MQITKPLTVREVADDLRVTTATVRNLIRRGHLDAFRVGRQWRVPEKSFERLMGKDEAVRAA